MAERKLNRHMGRTMKKLINAIVIIALVIVAIALAFIVFDNAWKADYHKDDLRDRPINEEFVYLGRDFRGKNYSFYGLIGPLGPPTEILYYATDVPPDDLASALPGEWRMVSMYETGCPSQAREKSCLEVEMRNDNDEKGKIMYISKSVLKDISDRLGFPIKPDSREYFIRIPASTMEYIRADNVDREVREQ